MSRIEIDISKVRSCNEDLIRKNLKVQHVAQDIFLSMGIIDTRIQARRNIGSRLRKAYDECNEIKTKLIQLEKFISKSMDRYEVAERKIENESEELIALWDLRVRTLTELKSMVGTLGTSSFGVYQYAKMFYDGEKIGGDEDLDEEYPNLNKAFLSAINKSDGESSDELISDIEKNKKSVFDTIDEKAQNLVNSIPNKLEMAWNDIKYISKSIYDNPRDFMVGAGVSIPDNLAYKGVFGLDSKLETMEFNLKSNKDYEGLTAIKAGQSGGDILTALLGGTIISAGGETDAAGVVLAVPTVGTVTVPLEAVGSAEIALGTEIMARSTIGLGDDLNSTFQYADKGEGNFGVKSSKISGKAFKDIKKRWGTKGVEAFEKARNKGIVGEVGQNGIKILKGKPYKGKYTYEIKVKNKEYGDYRVYGYKDDSGNIIFDLFDKALH